MRVIFMIIMLMFTIVSISAQTYTREGDKFISVNNRSGNKAAATKTKFVWQETNGTEYPVYMSSRGSCYIIKINKKTGKEYPKYLRPDISKRMCEELNVEYKGKQND